MAIRPARRYPVAGNRLQQPARIRSGLHPNLIRIFIDLQRDASSGRIYLLGALINCLADGTDRAAREIERRQDRRAAGLTDVR